MSHVTTNTVTLLAWPSAESWAGAPAHSPLCCMPMMP